MKRVDDFRLRLGNKEYVPIMIGGMGVDISTSELALEAARLGGIGHISDAMVQDVSDRKFDTSFVKEKTKLYKFNINNSDKSKNESGKTRSDQIRGLAARTSVDMVMSVNRAGAVERAVVVSRPPALGEVNRGKALPADGVLGDAVGDTLGVE